MKKGLFLLFMFLGFYASAQYIDRPNLSSGMNLFARPHRPILLSAYTQDYQFSKFKLPEVKGFDQEESFNQEKINMMALAQSESDLKKRNTISMQFPEKQLNQIKSNVQVFYGNQENVNYRTGNNLNYSGHGQTPDGGIKNEVYQDITQPFINPYYYNRNYYYPRRSSTNGNNLYFYMGR